MIGRPTVASSCVARLLVSALLAAGLAARARADEQARPATPASSTGESRTPAAGGGGAEPPAAGEVPAAAPDGTKRVVYIPESLKRELREEIKQEVLAQAKKEGWAQPNWIPEWLRRFHPSGDVRVRWERSLFPAGNAAGQLLDFNAINTNKPFDANFFDVANERFLNVDQNRTRPRLRARLGVDGEVASGFSAGLRLASGENNSPVSTNQTLGSFFSKDPFWLDRAFIRYAPFATPSWLAVQVGRFENPFFSTDLIWSDSVNLDGIALHVAVGGDVRPFLTAGVFPIHITAFSFPGERGDKLPSRNKWLYASQGGVGWKLSDALGVKLGGAFYYFDHLEGMPPAACRTDLKDQTCDSDDSRPDFAQKGNTYMTLRTPSPEAATAGPGAPEYQFFGLASRFRVVAATARIDLRIAPPLKLWVDGEFVRNVGFKKREVAPVAVNNQDVCNGDDCPYGGGNNGYTGRLTFGSPTQGMRWDWSVSLAYRYLQSDAVVDAFNDSDFGLGGTNLKGYVLSASLGLADGVALAGRWLSADSVVGPTYRVDVLQIDLQARF